jgi:glucokinase
VALALPHLGEGDAEVLRAGAAAGPRLALNVGTGLGGAVAVPVVGGWTALAAEPGHMRFGAVTEAERALLPMVETVEDLVSGRGIAELHRRLAGHAAAIPAEAVLARAGEDPIAGG